LKNDEIASGRLLDNCKLSSVQSGIANARLSGICNAALNIIEFVIQYYLPDSC